MTEFLKGNYRLDARIEAQADAADSTDEFEKQALSRLGGSICFVSKKGLMWKGEPQPEARRADREEGEPQPEARRADREEGDGAAKDTADGAGAETR